MMVDIRRVPALVTIPAQSRITIRNSTLNDRAFDILTPAGVVPYLIWLEHTIHQEYWQYVCLSPEELQNSLLYYLKSHRSGEFLDHVTLPEGGSKEPIFHFVLPRLCAMCR